MKLLSINIELNSHYKTVLDLIKREDPDVICFQEVLEEDYVFLKEKIGMQGIFRSWSYIHTTSHNDLIGKIQGVAIFAKNITDSGFIFYTGNENNILKSYEEYLSKEEFQDNTAFAWLITEDKKGQKFKIITTHIPVTYKGESTPVQLRHVDNLLKELDRMGEFVICGDTNAPRGKESFSKIAAEYKDNIPKEYKTSIDQNLHRTKGIQFMVDGLFTTPTYKASNVKLVDGVSDHMAIVANIDIIK